jgi:predicted nicotinamide N-methyase
MTDDSKISQHYKVSLSETEDVDIEIYVMPLRASGLDLVPWVSTYILANQLHKLNIPVPPKDSTDIPILELGAGIGLVALAGAMLWQRQVMITDLEPLVPGLQHIANMNKDMLEKRGGSADAGTLDWYKPDELTLHDGKKYDAKETKASVVMAADTIYDEDHPTLLAQTVLRWLAPGPDSRFISCQALRVAYLDYIREFWELLEQGGLEVINEGREEADAEWDDERMIEWSVWRWKQ